MLSGKLNPSCGVEMKRLEDSPLTFVHVQCCCCWVVMPSFSSQTKPLVIEGPGERSPVTNTMTSTSSCY